METGADVIKPVKDSSILRRLYGELRYLHDILHELGGETSCPQAQKASQSTPCPFRRDDDTKEYCDLLETTIVCHVSGRMPPIERIATIRGERASTTLHLFQYVVSTLLKQGRPSSNVLTLGHVKSSVGFSAVGTQGFTVKHPNTLLTVLKRKCFRQLLSRIGDSCFTALLLKYSIFVRLPNGCYTQIAGYPSSSLSMSKYKRSLDDPLPGPKRRRSSSGSGSHGLYFDRSKFFYASALAESVATKWAPVSRNRARGLVEEIFSEDLDLASRDGKRKATKRRLTKGLIRLVPLFETFLKRFEKIDYMRILTRHCPLPDVLKTKVKELGEETDVGQLLSHFSTPYQVISFVISVLLKGIPKCLWGSNHNWKVFRKNVDLLVRMKRFEKLSVNQLLHKMKSSHCDWLKACCPGSHRHTPLAVSQRRDLLFRRWLCWLVEKFAMPLIKGFFYVTESGLYRNRLFYFRKSLWKQVDAVTLNKIRGKRFEEILPGIARDFVSMKKSLGMSHIRILPKQSGSRIIINMGRKLKGGVKSINRQLEDLASVLSFEKEQHMDVLGASVFGVDDIYRVYSAFAAKRTPGKFLYFVKADISGCFDCIDHEKLLAICEQVISQEEYQIRRYAAQMIADGKVRVQFKRRADLMVMASYFFDFAKKQAEEGKYRNALLTDQVNYSLVERKSLLELLRAHICFNLLEVHGKCYRQTVGIPQGSVLSVLLCSFYLGHIENAFLHLSSDTLLMRMVDDYLIVAESKEEALAIYETIRQGLSQFNCVLNPSKTLTNFESSEMGFSSKRVVSSGYFPWCGYLFDMETLEVRVDYTRYEGLNLSYCLTVDGISHPFTSMKRRLLLFLKGKSHPLLLDERFNSRAGVRCNVYQVSYILALKTVVYLRELPGNCKQYLTFKNFRGMMSEFASHYCRIARRKFLKLANVEQAELALSYMQVYSLMVIAYYEVFTQKQGLFTKSFMRGLYRHCCKLDVSREGIDKSWKEPFEYAKA